MIIHKKDGIYVKNVKYHVNIEGQLLTRQASELVTRH